MRRSHWIVIACALLVAAGWYFFGAGLSVERVGPRPSAGGKVVLLLHGYGAHGDDLVSLATELSFPAPDVTFLVPAGPHRVHLDGRSWLPELSGSTREEYVQHLSAEMDSTLAKLWKVIDGVRKRGVDCKDITVAGFSQGGRVAAQLVASPRPDCALGGAILMSAGGPRDLPLPPAVARPPLRVLVSYGSADNVVSQRDALSPGRYFAESGHLVRFISFSGRHEIPAVVRDAIPRFIAGETVGEPLPPEP
jgi:phospholipase/carboxylesterase